MLRSLLRCVSTAQYGHSGVLGLLCSAAALSASWIAAPTRNSYPVLSCIVVSFLVDEMVDITGLEPVASSVVVTGFEPVASIVSGWHSGL